MRRIVVATAVMLVLVPGLAAAQPKKEFGPVTVFTFLRDLVVSLLEPGQLKLSPPPPITPAGDGGCRIDPNGGCMP
jgi:hypothetical protein